MFTVGYCCCGCSLRTGTLILLWFHTVVNAIFFLSTLPTLVMSLGLVPLAITLVYGLLLCLGILGLYGVYAKKPSFLFPFVVFNGIILVFQLIGMILSLLIITIVVNIFIAYLRQHLAPGAVPAGEVTFSLGAVVTIEIIQLIGVAIQTHFFLVIYSHYKELKTSPLDED